MNLQAHSLNLDDLMSKEWIVTNGIGGYAASSICGANTRREHGLLVVKPSGQNHKQVLLSKLEERIAVQRDTSVEFSTNQYPGAIHPKGYQYLKQFTCDPIPQVVFRIENQEVTKSIFMVNGSDTTVIEYHNTGYTPYQLSLLPLMVHRDQQSLFQCDQKFDFYYENLSSALKVYAYYGAPPLYLSFPNGQFSENRQWFYHMEYRKDRNKGKECHEDTFGLGSIQYYLRPGEKAYLISSTDRQYLIKDPEMLKLEELTRLENIKLPFVESLVIRDSMPA